MQIFLNDNKLFLNNLKNNFFLTVNKNKILQIIQYEITINDASNLVRSCKFKKKLIMAGDKLLNNSL